MDIGCFLCTVWMKLKAQRCDIDWETVLNLHLLAVFPAGRFPTQVVICDLRRDGRGVSVQSGGTWPVGTLRGAATVHTPWALDATQNLKFAKGDGISWNFRLHNVDWDRRLFTATNPILLLNYGVLALQLLHGLKNTERGGGSDSLFCQVEKEERLPSRVNPSSHLSTFASKPSRHLYNLSFSTIEICQTIFDGIYFKNAYR